MKQLFLTLSWIDETILCQLEVGLVKRTLFRKID